jgi:tRNA A37 methylthiotransferase MiaB
MTNLYLTGNSCFTSSKDLDTIAFNIAFNSPSVNLVNDPSLLGKGDIYSYFACGVTERNADAALSSIERDLAKTGLGKELELIITGCLPTIDVKAVKSKFPNARLMSMNDFSIRYAGKPVRELEQRIGSPHAYEDNPANSNMEYKFHLRDQLIKLDEKYGTKVADYFEATTSGFILKNVREPIYPIQIAWGCMYLCTYCDITKARGGANEYYSYPLDRVRKDTRRAIEAGFKRIILSGDETGNYGYGIPGLNLSVLLEALKDLPIDIGIRNIEPAGFLRHYDTIYRLSEEGRLFHLAVPIQSGSPRVLKAMNRSPKKIDNLLSKMKKIQALENPPVIITHIMIGFPGETEQDFEQSAEAVKQLNPDKLLIISYSPRPDTSAAEMPQVDAEIAGRRMRTLEQIAIRQIIEHLKQKFCEFSEEKDVAAILNEIEKAYTEGKFW